MILNLTQHNATSEQIAAGVRDLPAEARAELCRLLTVDDLPTAQDIADRCEAIANLIYHTDADEPPASVMIGGALWIMGPLVRALHAAGVVQCLAAFSRRESVEHIENGIVTKTTIFKHAGFVVCH